MKQKPGIAGDWHEPVMLLAKIPTQEGFKNGQKVAGEGQDKWR